MTLLFLQRLHLEHPAVHDRGTLAAALNEIVALFLIGRDLLFHGQIEFLRHLIPLLGVINNVKAVDHQRRLLFIQSAEQGDEVLENIHALHKSAGDKVHMAGDTQFGCLHSPQEIDADGFDLLAVCASLVEFKKLLRFSAAALHIHRIVQHEIITAEHPVVLTAADIRQLFIPVGFTIQGLFDQFPRKNTGGALIIAAVGKIDVRLTVYRDRNPLPYIACGRAERIAERKPGAAGVGNAHALAQRGQFILIHQQVCKRKV